MLKVGSCFSGIGCWELGLKYLEIEHSQEFCVEYDKYPYASYKAIHGDIKNYNDVTKVDGDEVEDIDLFTYSPPCQAFSVAGKGLGTDDHRGVLFFDALRIIQHKQPKLCIMENVKGLVGKKHKETFESILQCLTLAGYTNYWKVLNTKNYGIPQNRERVFIVSIRNDIDKGFEFPVPFDNGLRLKDLLEDEVDEKFYLSDKIVDGFIHNKYSENSNQVGSLTIQGRYESALRVYGIDGVAPACNTCAGGGLETKVLIPQATKQGFTVRVELPCICASRGRNIENPSDRTVGIETEQRLEFNQNGTSNALTSVQKDNYVVDGGFRIRKLTPKECFRLQNIKDEDFEKAEKVNSNSQLYKQAGNGISVNVPMYIYKQLQKFGYIERKQYENF